MNPSTTAAEAALMVEAMEEKRREAAKALRHVLATGPHREVEENIRYALEAVGSHEGTVCPGSSPELAAKMTADALTATSRALASRPPGELNAAVGGPTPWLGMIGFASPLVIGSAAGQPSAAARSG